MHFSSLFQVPPTTAFLSHGAALFGLHGKHAARPRDARASELVVLVALPEAPRKARRQVGDDAVVHGDQSADFPTLAVVILLSFSAAASVVLAPGPSKQ